MLRRFNEWRAEHAQNLEKAKESKVLNKVLNRDAQRRTKPLLIGINADSQPKRKVSPLMNRFHP